MSTARHSLRFLVLIVLAFAAISSSAQSYSVVTRFNLMNGLQPGVLTLGHDGNFYGTTSFGGDLSCNSGSGCGTVFRLTPAGTLTTLHSFSGPDGLNPQTVMQGSDGNLYGTTFCSTLTGEAPAPSLLSKLHKSKPSRGDSIFFCSGPGTFFRISPDGTLTTLNLFNGANGSAPAGALLQTGDGNFYGTTLAGGANNDGVISKATASGSLTILHSLAASEGESALGGLVQGSDGNFYGTTSAGGANGQGTVYKVTASGTLTTLHNFNTTDGATPNGSLLLASDGNFYGTTQLGGANYCSWLQNTCGIVYRMTPSGTLTTLYDFSGPDGTTPNAGLMQAADGNFYGTTAWGGIDELGVVFRLTPTGTLSVLHSACTFLKCADGETPGGPLVQGASGLLYGTAALGGGVNSCNMGTGCGTIFATSPNSMASQFVPYEPCRVFDSRVAGAPIQGGTTLYLDVPLYAQGAGCDDLTSATGFSLNITAMPRGSLGYLTVWPSSGNQPLVSTLNAPDGRTTANAVIVAGSTVQGNQGYVNIYASSTTDLAVDVTGYFTTPNTGTLQFYPLPQCRIVDTRNGQDGGLLQAGVERDYTMAGLCGIPAGAQTLSLNVTAIPAAGGLDYLTVWTGGEPRPSTSTLNASAGGAVANAAIVTPSRINQLVAFYANSNNTDLLVDVNGYFALAGEGGNSLYTVPNCRIYDSRDNNGQPFTGQITVNIAAEACAPPSNTQAYVFNATVVPSGTMPYLTLWAHGAAQPSTSTLNAFDGLITSNMAIVPTTDGSIDAYAAGLTQMMLDISGYFAP